MKQLFLAAFVMLLSVSGFGQSIQRNRFSTNSDSTQINGNTLTNVTASAVSNSVTAVSNVIYITANGPNTNVWLDSGALTGALAAHPGPSNMWGAELISPTNAWSAIVGGVLRMKDTNGVFSAAFDANCGLNLVSTNPVGHATLFSSNAYLVGSIVNTNTTTGKGSGSNTLIWNGVTWTAIHQEGNDYYTGLSEGVTHWRYDPADKADFWVVSNFTTISNAVCYFAASNISTAYPGTTVAKLCVDRLSSVCPTNNTVGYAVSARDYTWTNGSSGWGVIGSATGTAASLNAGVTAAQSANQTGVYFSLAPAGIWLLPTNSLNHFEGRFILQ